MHSLNIIKTKIQKLYKTNPNIHISITASDSKTNLKNEPAVIKNIYPHIFQIEENSSGSPKTHIFSYTEILIKRIVIAELCN